MKFLKPPAPSVVPADTWISAPVLVAAAIAIILVVWVLLWRRRRGAPTRGLGRARCKWRRGRLSSANLRKWRCKTCGQEAFSSGDKPPKECKQYLHATSL